jgi:hypothetical protein
VRVFNPPAFNQWEPVMAEVADELAKLVQTGGTETLASG